jgi:hypothetical protein
MRVRFSIDGSRYDICLGPCDVFGVRCVTVEQAIVACSWTLSLTSAPRDRDNYLRLGITPSSMSLDVDCDILIKLRWTVSLMFYTKATSERQAGGRHHDLTVY